MNIKAVIPALFTILFCLIACAGSKVENAVSDASSAPSVVAAPFNVDTAYRYVERQCAFGPRVPGTKAHADCAAWLEGRLRAYCDTLYVQHGGVTTFDGTALTITNLIGVFNPAAEERILLVAHWDCRPWADNDEDEAKADQPVMGANDAASGVAVLLEIARNLHDSKPALGVDILLVDAEDWGDTGGDEDSWALGTQYWAAHPHIDGYTAREGILLDMVGARGARFGREYFSMQWAPDVVRSVWDVAQSLGYSSYFHNGQGGAVTDDHVTINRMLHIPCIDIIDTRNDGDSGFFPFWHTTGDTIDKIDRATLKAVGVTLATYLIAL